MSETTDPGTEVPTPPTEHPTEDMYPPAHVLTGHDWTPPPPVIPVLPTPPVPDPAPPLVDDEPYVSQDGPVLSCTMGNWFYTPNAYAYQWLRDGSSIGTNTSTYLVVSADEGHEFTCVVTASNDLGSASATSNTVIIEVSN